MTQALVIAAVEAAHDFFLPYLNRFNRSKTEQARAG